MQEIELKFRIENKDDLIKLLKEKECVLGEEENQAAIYETKILELAKCLGIGEENRINDFYDNMLVALKENCTTN